MVIGRERHLLPTGTVLVTPDLEVVNVNSINNISKATGKLLLCSTNDLGHFDPPPV